MSGNKRFLIVLVIISAAVYVHSRDENTVGVNLHGVNHTAETFSFYLNDPKDPERISGGSGLIDPFGAGGISCCVVLPRKWEPGMKLKIHAKHWPKRLPDDESSREVKEVIEAEVPKYADGEPGEIWVLRHSDGKLEVVASDYQPDHPKWPGSVKGWPIPSIEYRRERWELYRELAANGVELYESLSKELSTEPERRAKEAWDYAKKDDITSLSEFSGPDDPLYIAKLKSRYAEGLKQSKQRLQEVMQAKP